jgi:hypothetical protein
MTSSNLDLLRSIYTAWERGDYGDTRWAHPEIEFGFADGPAPGAWTGLAAMAEAWRDTLGAWMPAARSRHGRVGGEGPDSLGRLGCATRSTAAS